MSKKAARFSSKAAAIAKPLKQRCLPALSSQNWGGRTVQCQHGRGGLFVYDADPVGHQLLGWDSSTMAKHVAVTLCVATAQGETRPRLFLAQRRRSRP